MCTKLQNILFVDQYKDAHVRDADAIKRAKVWVNFIPSDFWVAFF